MKRSPLYMLIMFFYIYCFLFSTPLFAASDEKEVVVMGVGSTEESAKRQAYRNAIQSVIGSMVLSETIVQNENLVQDKILSHSDGYVVKAIPIGSARPIEGGLIEVTMRITVKSQQLEKKLKAENISIAKVDGLSLFAQKKTQDEAKQDAASIIKEKLKDIPSSVLVATAFPDKAKQESKGGMVRLTLPVEVTVDKANYKKFTTDLHKTLNNLGFKPISYDWKGRKSHYRVIRLPYIIRHKKESIFLINVADVLFKETASARVKAYSIPKEVFFSVFQEINIFQLKIELLDAQNNIVASKTSSYAAEQRGTWELEGNVSSSITPWLPKVSSVLRLLNFSEERNSISGVSIFPVVGYFTNSRDVCIPTFGDAFLTNTIFDLTEEELASITSVKCTLENIPAVSR